MEYQIEKRDDVCATGATTKRCYDYEKKKVLEWLLDFVGAMKKYEALR